MTLLYYGSNVLLPAAALAMNFTEVVEVADKIVIVGERCLPRPKTFLDGFLCVAIIGACGAAALQGFGNVGIDAACVAVLRSTADRGHPPAS